MVELAAILRAEARRLLDLVQAGTDASERQALAARAVLVAQRAEAIEALQKGSQEIVRANISQYRQMLLNGIEDADQRQAVEAVLHDAEHLAQQMKSRQRD